MLYLITGASRGIGLETTVQLANQPDNTVLIASRNSERLAALADSINTQVGRETVYALTYDLATSDPVLLREWVATYGQLDGIINNAGLLVNKPFAELSRRDWETMFAVNLFGVVDVIRELLPLLNAGSHILNVSSMGGFQGSSKFPGLSAYSASKAALANLTECLAEELKDQQIAVNCLALGAVQTEMLAQAFPGFQAPVSSQQMGELMTWFVQQGHTFFNGKVLPVSISTP